MAAAVKSGAADCGLGILAAARALDMDFVPLFHERYDLVIPVEYYESELLAPLLDIIRDRTRTSWRRCRRWAGMIRGRWARCWRSCSTGAICER